MTQAPEMEKAVEAAARKLCPIDPDSDTEWTHGGKWYRAGIPHWRSWTEDARVALEAALPHLTPSLSLSERREEIATEIELVFKPLVMGQCISDWTMKQLVEAARKAADAILARPVPGDWQLVPKDDPRHEHANSALPVEMIFAGAEALDNCQSDLTEEHYVSGQTPDWDSGMIAVAVYRAMFAAAPAAPLVADKQTGEKP